MAWLKDINRINGQVRVAQARIDQKREIVEALLAKADKLSITAEANRAMAEAALAACEAARQALGQPGAAAPAGQVEGKAKVRGQVAGSCCSWRSSPLPLRGPGPRPSRRRRPSPAPWPRRKLCPRPRRLRRRHPRLRLPPLPPPLGHRPRPPSPRRLRPGSGCRPTGWPWTCGRLRRRQSFGCSAGTGPRLPCSSTSSRMLTPPLAEAGSFSFPTSSMPWRRRRSMTPSSSSRPGTRSGISSRRTRPERWPEAWPRSVSVMTEWANSPTTACRGSEISRCAVGAAGLLPARIRFWPNADQTAELFQKRASGHRGLRRPASSGSDPRRNRPAPRPESGATGRSLERVAPSAAAALHPTGYSSRRQHVPPAGHRRRRSPTDRSGYRRFLVFGVSASATSSFSSGSCSRTTSR